jgi:hypothetical protein
MHAIAFSVLGKPFADSATTLLISERPTKYIDEDPMGNEYQTKDYEIQSSGGSETPVTWLHKSINRSCKFISSASALECISF